MILGVAITLVGLVILYYGAESLVSGSSRLALAMGIRPLVVGLTVVAFATSMPELMVSLFAALKGSSSIAAGNIVGSNIANIALILGVAAVLSPLVVAKKTLTREIPMMIIASIAVFLLSLDGELGFYDGLPLIICLLIFVAYCVATARNAPSASGLSTISSKNYNLWKRDVFLIVLGIFCLGGGAELMVR
ncbi:MAG: sodium:calcium antiporter, partial [Deltaproteobacteria bacterium]|nr:sodium:calcium antiporter [Deltaproteobacteria bacterium]